MNLGLYAMSAGCRRSPIAKHNAIIVMPSKTFTTLTHGQARRGNRTREYETWLRMRARCTNPKSKDYKNYGGRGIVVCERWKNFEKFYEDMGPRPDRHSLDRKENNGNYEPLNCRWATKQEQIENRRCNRNFTINGVTGTMTALARYFGLKQQIVQARIDRLGWNPEKAFLTPVGKITRWKQNG
jgi:hypothetical protein